ncbi:hypothetical protein ANN_03461 [Periplaneta americana]|uniref:E3 ubiquitin-protein ligase n=1 Tax=Periplaneta americana TaxID=6978 RepID=A0ABQ8TZ35_PERAM|nr:hypothetical protein ANN_03461 [Periplaneta americana]
MDNPGKVKDQGLLKELECPLCLNYMKPPIVLCENGHNICKECKPKLSNCATCRSKILQVRNLSLESLARQAVYPCMNFYLGCKEVFHFDDFEEHRDNCVYTATKCLFSRISNRGCKWSGIISDMKEHIKDDHMASDYREVSGSFKTELSNTEPTRGYSQVIFTLNEMFFVLWRFKPDNFYCAVYYCGPKEKANNFKYKFTVSKKNTKEKLCFSFVTHNLTENVNDILKPGFCACIHTAAVKLFKSEGEKFASEIKIVKL